MAALYSPSQIADITNGVLHGNKGEGNLFRFLLTDSRKLLMPGETIFFALRTSKNDGHNYIADLVEKGVQCFIVERLPEEEWLKQASFILVIEPIKALQALAGAYRSQFRYPVIAITGSNGKTIVKEWLAQMLAASFSVVKNPRSYNSQIGVPLSVWQMNDSHELGVFEAGISRPGEMDVLENILKPDVGILTNIGPAHDEGFKNRQQKLNEKLKLFNNCSLLVYRADNEKITEQLAQWYKHHQHATLYSWGYKMGKNMQVLQAAKSRKFTRVRLLFDQKETVDLELPFTDDASLENALHCIACLYAMHLQGDQLQHSLKNLQPVAMRLELRQGINNCLLINDAYNSDLLSIAIALDFMKAQVRQKKKVIILSDILQSGMPPQKLYKEVAGLLTSYDIDEFIGVGTEIGKYSEFFAKFSARFYLNTESFLDEHDGEDFRDRGILIKGAREFEFERISNRLQYKDHQTLLEIDLDALVHNLNVYRALLRPGVKLAAMVKAFSYGSGSYEIANVLQYHGADYLAVAFADEGKELRNAGIHMPVMVLNPELHNLDILFRYNLEPEVYGISLLKRIIREAEAGKKRLMGDGFPVHIKLDTGMHRMGFMENEIDELISLLVKHPVIKVASVFSHLAASDLEDFDAFSYRQIQLFHQMSTRMEEALGYSFLKHIANSSAISRLEGAQMDMVRLGIGMYGVDGNRAVADLLRNVTTFKSVISQVKVLPAGDSVGYNRAHFFQKESTIAIVPVGYADGLNRKLGNGRGYMLVNGHKAPLVGNISMDMCTLDVTGLDVSAGDEVIIFGEELPVTMLAQKLDTIPYEIFTSIASRVKRIYFQE